MQLPTGRPANGAGAATTPSSDGGCCLTLTARGPPRLDVHVVQQARRHAGSSPLVLATLLRAVARPAVPRPMRPLVLPRLKPRAVAASGVAVGPRPLCDGGVRVPWRRRAVRGRPLQRRPVWAGVHAAAALLLPCRLRNRACSTHMQSRCREQNSVAEVVTTRKRRASHQKTVAGGCASPVSCKNMDIAMCKAAHRRNSQADTL